MKPIDNLKLNQTPSAAPNLKTEKAAPKKTAEPKAVSSTQDRVSLKGKQKPLPPKKWTVLAYLSGDCNLEEYMVQDLLDMEKIGSSKDMNLLVQLDRGDEKTATTKFSDGVKGASRYYAEEFKMKPGELDGYTRYNPATMPVLRERHTKITSPELKTLGQVNMADPKVLKDFLSWGMKNYPAKNYLIIAFGHGGGASGMITDEGAGPSAVIALPDLKKAVKGAEKAAGVKKEKVIIGLKSCQMGQIETAYELKDTAAYLLASQSTIYANAWPMDEIFGEKGVENKDPEAMARHIFKTNTDRKDEKEISTLSLIDLKKAPQAAKAVSEFAKALKESQADPVRLKTLMEIKSRPLFLANSEICHYNSDLYDAAQQIAGNPDPNDPAMLQADRIRDKAAQEKRSLKPEETDEINSLIEKAKANVPDLNDPKLKKAAENLMTALDKMVLDADRNSDEFGFDKNALGLGILATTDPERFSDIGYQDQAFSKKTGWDQAMTAYAPGVTMEAMNRSLSGGNQVRSQALKVCADIARKTVKEYDKLDQEFENFDKVTSKMKANPNRTPFQKISDVYYKMYDLLTPLTKMAHVQQEQEKDELAGAIFGEVCGEMNMALADKPELARETILASMSVISGLQGGKINSQTLGKSARNLLRAKKTMEKDLSKADRKKLNDLLQETSRDKKVEMLEQLHEEKNPAFAKAKGIMLGLEQLYILGYTTRNEQLINIKNYSGFNQLAFLKNLSELDKPQA